MSRFISPLLLRVLAPDEVRAQKSRAQLYELTAGFGYQSDLMGMIIVPIGFQTDFASIPRVAFAYIDPEDPAILMPSVVHDFLYSLKGVLPDGGKYSREDADKVLREAMETAGARAGQRFVVFQAVQLGGGSHWK